MTPAQRSPDLTRVDALVQQLLELLDREGNPSLAIFALAVAAAQRLLADAKHDEGTYHANFGLFISCVSRVAMEVLDEQTARES